MPEANDSVLVTPGSGATIATHLINAKEYQAVVIADGKGQIQNSNPMYRLIIPSQAVGANKVFMDLFNATGSGKIINIVSASVLVDNDTAVTGVVGVQAILTRTTAVGTTGTAAVNDGTSTTAATFARMDTGDAVVPAQITARLAPGGGATAGAYIGTRFFFTEETNAASVIEKYLVDPSGPVLVVRENSGIRILQGTVASVGNLAIEIYFYLY